MAANYNYPRPKVAVTNSTNISIGVRAAEMPNTPELLDGVNTPDAGTTGVAHVILAADADESGGADIQPWFDVKIEPVIATDGSASIKITATPVKGGGTNGSASVFHCAHAENIDTFQTAAGRARQA